MKFFTYNLIPLWKNFFFVYKIRISYQKISDNIGYKENSGNLFNFIAQIYKNYEK
jgi:hypothetical protein